MSDSHEDWDDDEYEEREPDCYHCGDSGKVIAADGYHEYIGYDYIPCPHCIGPVKPGDLPIHIPDLS
jgi:hypothetical protein